MSCVLIVLIFIISWIPRAFFNFSRLCGRNDLTSPLLSKLSFFFLFLQSRVNPLIYSVYWSDFRQAARRLINIQRNWVIFQAKTNFNFTNTLARKKKGFIMWKFWTCICLYKLDSRYQEGVKSSAKVIHRVKYRQLFPLAYHILLGNADLW